MKAPYAILILLLLSSSCDDGHQEFYDQQFQTYFIQEINTLPKANHKQYMYVINLSSCSSCTPDHLQVIQDLSALKEISFLIIGDTVPYNRYFDKIKEYKRFYFDPEQRISGYQTNLGKPLIMKISNGQFIRIKAIADNNYELIKKEVTDLLNRKTQ